MPTNNITVHKARIVDERTIQEFYETHYPTLHALIAAYCLDRWPSHMPTDEVIPTNPEELIELFFETHEYHGGTLHESSMTFPLPPPFSSALDLLAALASIERITKGVLAFVSGAIPAAAHQPDHTATLNMIRRSGQLINALASEALAAAASAAKRPSTVFTTPHIYDPDPKSGSPPPGCEPVPPH